VALADAGLPPGHEALAAAGRWLLAAQNSERAGWQEGQRETAAGEAGDLGPENAGYAGAGLETSAAIIQALRTVRLPADSGQRPAILWSLRWLVAVQRADGGWGWQPAGPASAAATRLARLDLGAAETRTAAEPTGQVVRALAAAGQPGALAIRRAVTCLLRMQRPDGSWPGDGGTSDLAATCTGLQALIAAGVLRSKPPAQRAAAWLARRQSPDGGWGPGGRCAAAGSAASTPESTAAALRALLAAGGPDTDGVERAVAWLVAAQLPDGGWDGPQPAGLSQLTGPTSALGSYLSAISAREVPGPRSAPAKPAKPTKPATAGQPAKRGTAGGRPAAGARKEGWPGRIPTSPG
jgi:squalene-hopene/tetraprenyl-beta-curcumene cyclase